MLWKVEINIPLLDAIKQIPKYAKFLKELFVHKRKKMKGGGGIGRNHITTNLAKEVSRSQNFSVPCTIGECTFVDAMLDLRASINVMPVLIYKSLNFSDLEPTGMTIQLTNRSIVQPLGVYKIRLINVLEDVLVQVNKLIFPVDFYVLDIEDETLGKGSTLILGRPFLMTARTKTDVHAKTLLMEFGDNLVQFNIFEAMKHPTKEPLLFGIDVIDELVVEYMQLDTNNDEFLTFVKDLDEIGYLGSVTYEFDYDELLEVQDLSNYKYHTIDFVDLDHNSKFVNLIDQVCKYDEEPECSKRARVQVVETKMSLPGQVSTILTTKYDSANQG
ncbi:hypothetical protein CR513_49904, partial [Mucuna pruriens]